MPEPPSLAQRGYEAFAEDMLAQGSPQRPWRALTQVERGAWAMASEAIVDGWEDLHSQRV